MQEHFPVRSRFHKRVLSLVAWSTLGVLVMSLMQSFLFLAVGMDMLPGWVQLFGWQVLLWAAWVPLVPLVVLVSERLRLYGKDSKVVLLSLHAIMCAVVLGMHALAGFLVTAMVIEGVELVTYLEFHLRMYMPIGLVVYALLAYLSHRVAAFGFRANADGLLVIGGLGSAASEPGQYSFGSTHTAVIVTDEEGDRILAVNRTAETVYGWRAREFVGRSYRALFDEDSQKAFDSNLRAPGDRMMWGDDARQYDAHGGLLEVSYIVQPVQFQGTSALLVMNNDLTELNAANRELEASQRKASELRAALADAKLKAYEFQLKPHFLFNALNTSAMLINSGDIGGAHKVVTNLGDLYRALLQVEAEQSVALARELELALHYLEIEESRFGERLKVETDIEASCTGALVPPLILQPVVENAVKHGAARTMERSTLVIRARERDGRLVIEVTNAIGSSGRGAPGTGTGIRNTCNRLEQMYGDAAGFTLEPRDGIMVATLIMPFESGPGR